MDFILSGYTHFITIWEQKGSMTEIEDILLVVVNFGFPVQLLI